MKLSPLFKTVIYTAASIAVLAPGMAMANSYIDSIRSQLVRVSYLAGFRGYSLQDVNAGTMRSNSSKWMTTTLRKGVSYRFVGVCDQDCGDVDLKIYDSNGNLIDSDTRYDRLPVVGVTPRWSGRFSVKLSMPSCSARYCYYGLGMFR